MKRSDINPMPEYFDRYILRADDIELSEALEQSLKDLDHLPIEKWEALGDRVYAPGKWTVMDILQHIIDTERIFTYRALCFARRESERMLSFDEDAYANHAEANRRTITDLLAELRLVRQSTIAMFRSFTDDMLQHNGMGFKGLYSVLAIGFIMVGHQKHHLGVLEEKYYPLLD